MSGTIFMILADGFEDIEAVAPLDIFRRLGLKALTVGLKSKTVTSSHGVTLTADAVLDGTDLLSGGAIVLPGGLPGAVNLRDSASLAASLAKASEAGMILAAICAGPIVLENAGVLCGCRVTGYPGCEVLSGSKTLVFSGSEVEVDGHIITARGPGASFAFARAVAESLGVKSGVVDGLYEGMFVTK